LLIYDYFDHSSAEKERRLLDEKCVEWIVRRMKMITKEKLQGKIGGEKEPATESPDDVELMLCWGTVFDGVVAAI
jgi:hypothetical protein